jgi:hypothetical protein
MRCLPLNKRCQCEKDRLSVNPGFFWTYQTEHFLKKDPRFCGQRVKDGNDYGNYEKLTGRKIFG